MDDVFMLQSGVTMYSAALYRRVSALCNMPPEVPRIPVAGHVHNFQNASTAMLPSNMRRTRLYLAL